VNRVDPTSRVGGVRREPDSRPGARRGPARKRRIHHWLRVTHVYTSMFGLVLMLFFGATGVTLNHPDWSISDSEEVVDSSGILPPETISGQGDGTEVLISVSEYARSRLAVTGEVVDFEFSGNEGTINYRAPGYSADLFFDGVTGDYRLTTRRQGFVGVMNALHAGRDSSSGWRLAIDISGVLLTVIAVTGIGIQLFLRKRRGSALAVMVVGALLTIVLIMVAMP